MIEFLQDYTTEALPPEHFSKGEQVSRSEESERYFVGRGLAGYLVDGKLVDADHRPIVTAVVAVEVVTPGERRADPGFRAGEVMTGQPPRASSGPGVPFVEPEAGMAGAPPVVLEAEVERLKAALLASEEMFHDMNNSHVSTAEDLRSEVARLSTDLAAANELREQALSELAGMQDRHEQLSQELEAARRATDEAADRVADLERQLEAASKPAEKSAGKQTAK